MSRPPGTLLESLGRRPRRDRALSRDGDGWLTVGDLLDRAAADARAVSPGGAVAVPGDDPVAAVRLLLAAQVAGAVPVVGAGPGGRQVLEAAARLTPAPDDDGPLLVVVTSGSTTGLPRAVVRTARSWDLSLPAVDELLGPEAGPGTVAWAPGAPSATLTLFALWHGLATGRPVVAPGAWQAGRALGSGAGARSLQCVPAVLADVLDARGEGGPSRLRRALVAGAAPPPGLLSRSRAAGCPVAEYYGAAELSFVAADPDGDGLRAFPGVELAVREGVIWARSPYLARGYLDSVSGALRHDAHGWATVGDLGGLSGDGVLTVRGRGDGTAGVGGTTVLLADVERALRDVPGVAEVVALAEPDARFGERVVAVVRPRPGGAGLVASLRAQARRELPAAARPVRYVVRDRIPRLGGGKVARAALRAQLLAEVRRAPAGAPGPGPTLGP